MTKRSKKILQAAWPFAAAALLFYGFRRAARRRRALPAADLVDETSLESFPASDPPSWTSATLQ